MDSEQRSFVETFRAFLEDVVQSAPREQRLTPLGELVETHLGTDVTALPAVTEAVLGHRLVDADLALAHLANAAPSRLVGVSHGQMRGNEDLTGLLKNSYVAYSDGPVDYASVATGPATERQIVTFGLHLLVFAGKPIAILQRAPQPERGHAEARLEILSAEPLVAAAVIREIRELMVRLSVLRGQVLSLTGNEYGNGAAGATFLERPTITANEIVLADGILDAVTRHVVGIGEQREHLLDAGQHLKRGVLLYGPPGTGKTLTVRHLLARTPGTTAVLLTGPSIQFVTAAAELARAMQPSIVVLEDVDLVAGERGMHFGPQPLLFAVLDALDGLDGDADVAFLLTSNRVELLESALAERPGRVDLAVEIGLPDASARRRLFALYARDLPFSSDAVAAAADRSEGVTGSFAKELVRRAVLVAAEGSRQVTDADLDAALDDLLSARQSLTRSLLGGGMSEDESTSESHVHGGSAATRSSRSTAASLHLGM